MQNFEDDNGEILTIAPTTIVIPNDYKLKNDVFTAIGSDQTAEMGNNGFNYTYGRWEVIVNPYLNSLIGSTDKPFFVFDKNYNENYYGLIFMDRIPLTMKSWIDNNTGNNVWNGRARFVCGANDWREIAVGGVTGGTAL